MGDKKKKGGGGAGQEEDDTTAQISAQYRRRCEINSVTPSKFFQEKLDLALEEETNLIKLVLWDELGPVGTRALMDSFCDIDNKHLEDRPQGYQHLVNLQLCKTGSEDQGVRTVCNYMDKVKSLEYLRLSDNKITPLGCQFLGKSLMPYNLLPLKQLVLDHNEFGTKGLQMLTYGLSTNTTLEKLSLCHCAIDEKGAKYIQQICANIESSLIGLKLFGNVLKNQGFKEILRMVVVNEKLEKLNVGDNQIDLSTKEARETIVPILIDVMKTKKLGAYDIGFNAIGQQSKRDKISQNISQTKNFCLLKSATLDIIQTIPYNKAIWRYELSGRLQLELCEEVKKALKGRKKPKQKGKKKGKK